MKDGYTKIKVIGSTKSRSRSIDFSDLSSLPPQPMKKEAAPIKEQQTKNTTATTTRVRQLDSCEEQGDGNGGERFGAVVTRNCSVSSSTSSGLQDVVKRAFSMRRSSSVSERYCRIHDQFVTLASSPINEDGEDDLSRSVKKKKNKAGKILKACKRIFGL